ncbi:MAG: hypothetical protein ABI282_09395 [Candidatus Baltobacteraceae bacterium]
MESFARTGIAALVAAVALSAPLSGTFALLGGAQNITAQMIVARSGSETFLDIAQTKRDSRKPILAYDVDMTQTMHLVIVSDDFTQFLHVHPAFNAKTGHFTIAVPLAQSRAYYAYADTKPTGIAQQVFRFAIEPGTNAPQSGNPSPAMTPSPVLAHAGPYAIKLGATELHANTMLMIPVTIEKGGRLANDLRPYLGAAAHAVFIDTATLAYVHVHPELKGRPEMHMAMGDMHGTPAAGPEMTMHVAGLPVGTYKLWLQFRGGTTLYAAPFTIVAR